MEFRVETLVFGLSILLMNLGGKHVVHDLRGFHARILENSVVMRRVILWCIIYVGTKDVAAATILTAAFVVLTSDLLFDYSSSESDSDSDSDSGARSGRA